MFFPWNSVLTNLVPLLRVGRLARPLMALFWALVGGSIRLVAFVVRGSWRLERRGWLLNDPQEGNQIMLALQELWAGAGTLLVRLRDWSLALVTDEASFDLVAVALVWSLALWAVAAWAGWSVRRRDQSLAAVAPLPGPTPIPP